MYVGHTHSTRRQMYIVCVCVSSTLRVPFRYPSGSLLRSKLDPLASMGWLWVAWALLAVAPAPLEPEARNLAAALRPGQLYTLCDSRYNVKILYDRKRSN